ncbi:chemotaxis protein CheB [Leptospira sp. 96542]|nr:chemotaxis protein CheB [Leptospira sp. 96542]
MPIKILIVEDNPLIQLAYKKSLSAIPDFSIIGIASNGVDGLRLNEELDPDVILCDLNMPIMDGFEFTKQVMLKKPKPILIISDLVQNENSENIFKVLQNGALDVLPKPKMGGDIQNIASALELKIRILSGVFVFTKKNPNTSLDLPKQTFVNQKGTNIVLIGASTGGPQAFQHILSSLPSGFPYPIFCVQHISPGFGESMVEWLGQTSELQIKTVVGSEIFKPGFVYFPKDDHHLIVEKHTVTIEASNPKNGHRPSVGRLFESALRFHNTGILSFLLTGMGDDGARELKLIKDSGGYTIAQDETSSVVYGMPRVANEIGAANEVLSLDAVVSFLRGLK